MVTDCGRVLNKDRTERKRNINHKGYVQISMKIDGKWTTRHLHTLLAHLFIRPKQKGEEVDHINNIRTDNRLSNLQYLSKSDNNKKSYASGNRDVSGSNNANSKYSEQTVRKVCGYLQEGVSPKLAAHFCDVSINLPNSLLYGGRWKSITKDYKINKKYGTL